MPSGYSLLETNEFIIKLIWKNQQVRMTKRTVKKKSLGLNCNINIIILPKLLKHYLKENGTKQRKYTKLHTET